MSELKKALVLSGGSIKGAFEAGAVKAIVEKGYKPEYIYGISVGCLNSTFIANEAAQQFISSGKTDWDKIGQALWNFWSDEINSPDKLVKKKCDLALLFGLNWSLISNNFKSILSTQPLQDLVKKKINPDVIRKTPVKLEIGAVNIYSGAINYVTPDDPDFLSYVVASTAIPITMPVQVIKGIPYVDGGLRDVAPFGRAINNGADEIIGVCCQSENLDGHTYNYKNLIKYVERLMDIMVNETINNDIRLVEKFNKILTETNAPEGSELSRFRYVEHTIIRPETEISLDIESFNHNDIVRLLELGYSTAKKQLESKKW